MSREHHMVAMRRVAVAAVVGAIVFVVVLVVGGGWTVAVTGGWVAAAFVFIVWWWSTIGGKTAAQTKEHARRDDFSRPTADLVLLCASVASLVAVGFTLVDAGNQTRNLPKALLILLAVVAVGFAWGSVHTVYAVRYAGQYYGDPVGGIDFNDKDDPDYKDFAYLALTIGMTFQVSDTSLESKAMRRIALRHALLSYLFGTVIVAITINTVASLLK